MGGLGEGNGWAADLIFASLSIAAAAFATFLPETQGAKLPNAFRFGSKAPFSAQAVSFEGRGASEAGERTAAGPGPGVSQPHSSHTSASGLMSVFLFLLCSYLSFHGRFGSSIQWIDDNSAFTSGGREGVCFVARGLGVGMTKARAMVQP